MRTKNYNCRQQLKWQVKGIICVKSHNGVISQRDFTSLVWAVDCDRAKIAVMANQQRPTAVTHCQVFRVDCVEG